ncbi:hypothetical protein B0O99DRAFT_677842 [Bisporella sp. PMI_857]|nr:hypothetical protein B0O99DRAFT_677842 [Bisporella sp. PMI_857]
MARNFLLLTLICIFIYLPFLRAEIFPGRRHPELNGPPRGWDQAANGFEMQPASPALQGPGASFSILSFLNKRQFGDCPSGAPIECGGSMCCYNGFSTCCDTKCCSANTTCINSVCCPLNAKVCPNGKCTYSDGECCPAGHTCGGTSETGFNSNDTCCGDSCCYFGAKCCGDTCCFDDSEHCCGGVCCPKDADCVANGTACERVRGGKTFDVYIDSTVTKTAEPRTSSTSSSTTTPIETTSGSGTASATSATGANGAAGLKVPWMGMSRKSWVLGLTPLLYYLV